MSGVGYLGTALVGGSNIDTPIGWAFLAVAGAGMGVAVPGLVAGAPRPSAPTAPASPPRSTTPRARSAARSASP